SVGAVRQARNPYSAVAFVADVQADQQRGNLLDKASVLQFAAINRSHTGDLRREFHRKLRGILVVAAYDYVAIDIVVSSEFFCGQVVECGRDRNALRNKFRRLLRRRALPYAEGAAGAATDARSERNGGVDQNAAGADRGFQLLQQFGLSCERHGEHEQIGGGAGGRIFHSGNLRVCAHTLADRLGRLLGARGIARSDDDGLSRTRPAQRQARTCGSGAAEDGDGAGHAGFHAKSGASASETISEENDSTGSLICIREYFVLRSAGMRPISRINDWKSSGLVYCPAVAPASREIFSSISVPPKSFAPACKHSCERRRFSFTHET